MLTREKGHKVQDVDMLTGEKGDKVQARCRYVNKAKGR